MIRGLVGTENPTALRSDKGVDRERTLAASMTESPPPCLEECADWWERGDRPMWDDLGRLGARPSTPSPGPSSPTGARPVFVVGSGKGGVGKSLLSAMLAGAMAQTGRRVLLVDGDQGLGTLHVLLGLRPPVRLEDLVRGTIAPEALLYPVTESLVLLPSDSGSDVVYRLEATDRARLHYQLSTLYDRFDAVVVDTGAGIESVVRAGAMEATRVIVVTTPEPTALTNGHALIKAVSQELGALPIDLLVNRAVDEEDGRRTAEKMAVATERFLHRGVRYLGMVPEHHAMRAAAREPRLVLHAPVDDTLGPWLRAVVRRLELPPVLRLARPAALGEGAMI